MLITDNPINWLLRKLFKLPVEMPHALPMEGWGNTEGEYTWEDWHKEMKTKYPIRHYLSQELPIKVIVLIRRLITEPYYWLRTHTVHRYHMLNLKSPNNGYAWGYCDPVNRLMYAMFAVLVDFVEKEDPLGTIDWDDDKDSAHARDEFMELYNWWKSGRKTEHDALYATEFTWQEMEALDARDDEQMARLVKIRGYLWT